MEWTHDHLYHHIVNSSMTLILICSLVYVYRYVKSFYHAYLWAEEIEIEIDKQNYCDMKGSRKRKILQNVGKINMIAPQRR